MVDKKSELRRRISCSDLIAVPLLPELLDPPDPGLGDIHVAHVAVDSLTPSAVQLYEDKAAAAEKENAREPDKNRNVWDELVAPDEKKRSKVDMTKKGEPSTKFAHP